MPTKTPHLYFLSCSNIGLPLSKRGAKGYNATASAFLVCTASVRICQLSLSDDRWISGDADLLCDRPKSRCSWLREIVKENNYPATKTWRFRGESLMKGKRGKYAQNGSRNLTEFCPEIRTRLTTSNGVGWRTKLQQGWSVFVFLIELKFLGGAHPIERVRQRFNEKSKSFLFSANAWC